MQDLVSGGKARKLTDTNPELADLTLGASKPIHWRSFDGADYPRLAGDAGLPLARSLGAIAAFLKDPNFINTPSTSRPGRS